MREAAEKAIVKEEAAPSAPKRPRPRSTKSSSAKEDVVENWQEDGRTRCAGWFTKGPPKANMLHYHDAVWGRPSRDDAFLFEMLALSSCQAGLRWSTVYNRRDGYRRAFADFDVARVAAFTDADTERLLKDEGIIRNAVKVKSILTNGRAILAIQNEFGSFADYLWSFIEDGRPIVAHRKPDESIPARSELGDRIAGDMKKRGFHFAGPVIVQAFIVSVGLFQSHDEDCFVFHELHKK